MTARVAGAGVGCRDAVAAVHFLEERLVLARLQQALLFLLEFGASLVVDRDALEFLLRSAAVDRWIAPRVAMRRAIDMRIVASGDRLALTPSRE